MGESRGRGAMMRGRKTGRILTALATALALGSPMPVTAIVARPPATVGPPEMLSYLPSSSCRPSFAQPGGSGPGMPIPFPALALGAPVVRTTTSFTTGGGGTSNAAIAAQRKAAGLPWQPPLVDPASKALPAAFADERGSYTARAFGMHPPYQIMRLAPAKGVTQNAGLIYAQAISPTRGRIAALTLYLDQRPTGAPRLRLTMTGPADHGCPPRTLDVYAPGMSAAAIGRLFAAGSACRWTSLAGCRTRADWPRGRVLFVTLLNGKTYEYRWIDYDLLAEWQPAPAR